jgi:hypothetical protein
MGIKHNYTATGTNDGTKQVSVNRWNEDHIIDGPLDLNRVDVPSVPSDNTLSVFAQSLGGRIMLSQIGPSGIDTALQPHLGGNKVACWIPPGNGTTVPGVFGMATMTSIGTVSTRNIATTNIATRMSRIGYTTAATAGSLCGIREAAAKYTTGAGQGLGGFFARYRFVISDASNVSGARMFIGLSASTTAPTNVEPNTLINSIGLVQISSSPNLHMYSSGSPAGSNLVDLGSGFPAQFGSTTAYELSLFGKPDGSVGWKCLRIDTMTKVEGEFTIGNPVGTVLLCHQLWRTNNTTALAVGLDVCSIYIETDY